MRCVGKCGFAIAVGVGDLTVEGVGTSFIGVAVADGFGRAIADFGVGGVGTSLCGSNQLCGRGSG